MNAIFYSIRKQIINYIKNNIFIIIISILPIAVIVMFFSTNHFGGYGFKNLETNYTIDEFNALFIFLISIYFILNMFNFDQLPITKAEATKYFIAPIKQQKVLLYFIFKSYASVIMTLLGIIYADLYIVSSTFNFGINKFIILLGLQGLFFILINSFNYLLLAIKNNYYILYNIIKMIFFIISFSIIFGVLFVLMKNLVANQEFNFQINFKPIVALLNNNFYTNLPFINIFCKLNQFLFEGKPYNYLVLTFGLIIIFTIVAYNIKFNYADKVFEIAERYEQKKNRATNLNKDSGSSDLIKTQTVENSKTIHGRKEFAIISKNLIEYNRLNPLIFNLDNLLFFLILISFIILINNGIVISIDELRADDNIKLVFSVVEIFLSFYFITLMPKKTTLDFSNPTYFLLPISSMKKILSGFLISNITNFLNGIVAFVILIFDKNNLQNSIFLAIIAFSSSACCMSIDIFLNTIMKEGLLKPYKIAISVFIKIIYFGITLFTSISTIFIKGTMVAPLLVTIMISIVTILINLTLTKIIMDGE